MSTTITTRLERRIEANPRGLTIIETIRGDMIQAALTPDEARQIAAALTADQGGQWTPSRGDLWSVTRRAMSEVDPTRKLDTAELDALASYVADKVAGHALARAGQAERERDAALARAEKAERERDACGDRLDRQGQSIATLQGDFLRVERERNEAVERADQAEARIDGWREAYDALMENPCPVTLDEVEKAIDTGVRGTTDGDLIDPDSDLPAGECVRLAVDAVCDLFGIEAEQAADPVEKLAKELWPILHPDEAPWRESVSMSAEGTMHGAVLRKMMGTARAAARHVLGQEADHA